MKNIFYIAVIVSLLLYFSHGKSMSDNRYLIHTKFGNIQSRYHNSRDLNNGWMMYYNLNEEQKYIEYWKVDSVTVISENWMSCGPRNKDLKYRGFK